MKQPSQARATTKKHVILFLAANPRDTGRLALDHEARSIHLELKRSGHRDRFDFQTRWAAEPLDLLRELRELRPTVVHVSGHGRRPAQAAAPDEAPAGLVFHDPARGTQVVSAHAVAEAFAAAGSSVVLVVLSACFTDALADALLAHTGCVVGMTGSIHDDAARGFAIGFYGGLGEHESGGRAFAHGRAAMHLEGLPDADRPRLRTREGLDPSELVLAAVAPAARGPRRGRCPYRGMRPYTADDADRFHGRDEEIQELLGRLRMGEREIYLIGPSGSGKSSLVAA